MPTNRSGSGPSVDLITSDLSVFNGVARIAISQMADAQVRPNY
jgi:hypothetical protein